MALACVSATPSRHKRNFSWLPTFLGGTPAATETADEEATLSDETAPLVEDNRVATQSADDSIIDPSNIGSIVSNGQIFNNELHYPVWRVHKYQGLHLEPLPISIVQDTSANDVTNEETPAAEPRPATANVQSWLTPELVRMAREFGVNDFSNVPSLQEAMDLLGTTTKEETVDIIKEFAATEDGRSLIRQYFTGANTEDNEVAASENNENVENVEENKDTQNAEAVENANNFEGQETSMIAQYLSPEYQSQLISQLSALGVNPAQTEDTAEADEPDTVDTTTPANFFGRITQWANFLNPLTGRQEIPIPPSQAEINEPIEPSTGVIDENISNQDTVQIPDLPELQALPSVPGLEQPAPGLPNVHIPTRYIPPVLPYAISGVNPKANGHYVHVRLPLAGFNPTPQYYIDPKYLHYGRNQLNQQSIQNGAPVPYAPFAVQTAEGHQPVNVYHRVATVRVPKPNISNQFVRFQQPIVSQIQNNQSPPADAANTFVQPLSKQPIQVNQPTQAEQQIPGLQAPTVEVQQFQSPDSVIHQATHIGQLPLVNSANYEVFRNAPDIKSSYGSPALPFSYRDIQSPNKFYVSPEASTAYIHQEYEVRPSASEVVEQKIKLNDAEPVNTANEEDAVHAEEEKENVVAQSYDNNDKITPDANRNIENDQSEQQKAIDVAPTVEKKEVENVDNEPIAELKPSTESSVYRNLRPSLKIIKKPTENRPAENQAIAIQRVARNHSATGKVYRSDQKAIDMLPYTLRHMAQSNDQE